MNARYKNVLMATAAIASLIYAAAAPATNFTSVVYDEKLDVLVIKIAYRGTNADHHFSIQWDECRRLNDEQSQISGLLVDSDPMDRAMQEFSEVLEIDMATYPCRPAKVTVRTATGFNRSVDVPKAKSL